MDNNLKRLIIKVIISFSILYIGFFVLYYKTSKVEVDKSRGIVPDEIVVNKTEIKLNQEEKKKIKIIENINTNKEQIKEKLLLFKSIQNLVVQTVQGEHGVGDEFNYNEQQLNKICNHYKQICYLTKFYGNIDIKDKIKYQAMIIYIMTKLNTYLKYNENLIDTINSITIKVNGDGLRGYAGASTITINLLTIKSYGEFREVLTHELGHIIDLGVIKGNGKNYDNRFTEFGYPAFKIDDKSLKFYKYSWEGEKTKLKTSDYLDFVSGYAMSDPFEDFAESFNLYLNHNSVFKSMSKDNYLLGQKYNYIKSIIGNNTFFKNENSVLKLDKDRYWRPWDTTKIIN